MSPEQPAAVSASKPCSRNARAGQRPDPGPGYQLCFALPAANSQLGNAGRNILRADGIGYLDVAVIKSFPMPYLDGHSLNFRGEFFSLTNSRNFGISEGRITNAGFLNQWSTDGGNRRVVFTLRSAL